MFFFIGRVVGDIFFYFFFFLFLFFLVLFGLFFEGFFSLLFEIFIYGAWFYVVYIVFVLGGLWFVLSCGLRQVCYVYALGGFGATHASRVHFDIVFHSVAAVFV